MQIELTIKKIRHSKLLFLLLMLMAQSSQAIIPFGFFKKRGPVNCAIGTPTPGALCTGGTYFLGTLSPGATSGSGTDSYMTTPGGCGEIPAGQKVTATNTPNGDYPNADFTPTCSGTDALTKYWNDGTSYWYDIPTLTNYTTTNGVGHGATNLDDKYGGSSPTNTASDQTGIIVAITAGASGGYHAAARYCDKLNYGGYTDWYLPNRQELNLFWVAQNASAGSIPGLVTSGSWYWSSTEYNNNLAWIQRFSDGNQSASGKYNTYLVRCVRRF